jgi:hypothetical protein
VDVKERMPSSYSAAFVPFFALACAHPAPAVAVREPHAQTPAATSGRPSASRAPLWVTRLLDGSDRIEESVVLSRNRSIVTGPGVAFAYDASSEGFRKLEQGAAKAVPSGRFFVTLAANAQGQTLRCWRAETEEPFGQVEAIPGKAALSADASTLAVSMTDTNKTTVQIFDVATCTLRAGTVFPAVQENYRNVPRDVFGPGFSDSGLLQIQTSGSGSVIAVLDAQNANLRFQATGDELPIQVHTNGRYLFVVYPKHIEIRDQTRRIQTLTPPDQDGDAHLLGATANLRGMGIELRYQHADYRKIGIARWDPAPNLPRYSSEMLEERPTMPRVEATFPYRPGSYRRAIQQLRLHEPDRECPDEDRVFADRETYCVKYMSKMKGTSGLIFENTFVELKFHQISLDLYSRPRASGAADSAHLLWGQLETGHPGFHADLCARDGSCKDINLSDVVKVHDLAYPWAIVTSLEGKLALYNIESRTKQELPCDQAVLLSGATATACLRADTLQLRSLQGAPLGSPHTVRNTGTLHHFGQAVVVEDDPRTSQGTLDHINLFTGATARILVGGHGALARFADGGAEWYGDPTGLAYYHRAGDATNARILSATSPVINQVGRLLREEEAAR